MPTVVIIHAAEDTLPARALAEKLRLAKLTVTLELPPGEPLKEAVRGANVVVALWSPRSVDQPAIIEEVAAARGKVVIHTRMQNAANPQQFKNEKSIDLTGWRGEEEFPAWRELAKAVTNKAGVPNIPPPAPRPPSGFFQPGSVNPQAAAAPAAQRGGQQQQRSAQRSPPPPPPRQQQTQQSAPRRQAAAPAPSRDEPKKGSPMVMIAIVTFLVVAVAGGGGYYYLNNMQAAKATSASWENIDKNDAAALRAFIAGTPGQYRQEATQTLATLEEQSFDAAKDADSIEAFQGFLTDFPESSHALEARGRIAELRAQPDTATTLDTATTTDTAVAPEQAPPAATTTATTAPPAAGGPVPLTPSTTTTTP